MGDNEVATTPNHHTPRTDDRGTTSGVRRASNGRSLVGATDASATIPEGRTSVVGRTEYSHVTPHRKARPETIWSISHHRSIGTGNIQTPSPGTMEHSSGVSCGSPYTI